MGSRQGRPSSRSPACPAQRTVRIMAGQGRLITRYLQGGGRVGRPVDSKRTDVRSCRGAWMTPQDMFSHAQPASCRAGAQARVKGCKFRQSWPFRHCCCARRHHTCR